MTSSPALSDDLGHLVNLSLRTAEGAESLLSQLAGALVLGVAEEFDDAALIWCEAEESVSGFHLAVQTFCYMAGVL